MAELTSRISAAVSPSGEPAARAIRVAYLVSQYPAVSHTFIHREVRQLRRLGFSISVASINSPDRRFESLPAEEQEESRDTFYVKGQGAGRAVRETAQALFSQPVATLQGLWFAMKLGAKQADALALHLFYFIEAMLIFQWMKRKGIRHLHVHFGTQAATVGLILAKTFAVPFSLTIHGPDEFYNVEFHHLAEKVQAAGLLCCIGYYARSQLMKLSSFDQWHKIRVAPLGVDTDQFFPRPFRADPDPFEILCVGRLVPAKGQHILLKAVALLCEQKYRVLLHIVGDGPDRASLERQARLDSLTEVVVFHGSVNQDRIREFLERADAFVLPSFAEGIPVALMEAMSMEIPCISTRITGIPELIRDGIDGLLVAPSDEFELARAIARLMTDSSLQRELGAAGRRRVISHYHLETNVERLAALLTEYAASHTDAKPMNQ